jgi:hypothetical protein
MKSPRERIDAVLAKQGNGAYSVELLMRLLGRIEMAAEIDIVGNRESVRKQRSAALWVIVELEQAAGMERADA